MNGTCIDKRFVGESCVAGVDKCQGASFCNNGKCDILFSLADGAKCEQDNQCAVGSVCHVGVCTIIPPWYGNYCGTSNCSYPLSCIDGICQFSEQDRDRMLGCRTLYKEAIDCSGRVDCLFQGSVDGVSCSMVNGCRYQWIQLRNCLFCESDEVRNKIYPCSVNLCRDAGFSQLFKVVIAVALICGSLIALSILWYCCETRKANRQRYVEHYE